MERDGRAGKGKEGKGGRDIAWPDLQFSLHDATDEDSRTLTTLTR